MRIQCFLPLFNEWDIARWSIPYLLGQGISVHVIDGWSTDGGWEQVQKHALLCASISPVKVTCERFPADGDDGIWNCTRLLTRVQNLAWQSGADWCMLNDADEFRSTPNGGLTLSGYIGMIDEGGYNVIDHRVLSFQATDDGWTPDHDPQEYFRYYTTDPATDGVCGPTQEKIWRNDVPVDLVTSGGHIVGRANKRIAPEKFVMRHYPFRTVTQYRAKLEARLRRRCHEEHNRGWGIHYDSIDLAAIAPRDPKTLQEWTC